MGKKGAAAALLAGLALRLAVLAGAGEPVERWVRARWGDGRLVRASLQLELGTPAESAPPDAQASSGAPGGSAAYALSFPASDGTVLSGGDASPAPPAPAEPLVLSAPETPEPAAEAADAPVVIRAADLSGKDAVHDRSGLGADLDAIAAEGLSLRLDPDGPQVLILHTHGSEAYTPDGADRYVESDPYRTQDLTQNVVRVGDALASALEAQGLTVLHDRSVYDYPSYTGSYGRSGAAAERYLRDYPTLRVVIDLHRDALGSGDTVYKTAAVVEGRACAQVMLLVGTGANGLPHPAWRENLKLALLLQNAADARYPSLTRPVELVPERYNQQLCPGMLILEVGSTGNTLREALTAATCFGEAAGGALAALMEK